MNKRTTKLNPVTKLLLPLSISATLVACGGTGQDAGTPASFSQTFSGIAIDGHLARSLVFLDFDNNGTRDPWEPFAFTDNDGYYSFNQKTKVDYCAENAGEELNQYCLKTSRQTTNVVVRVDGGYDVLTGEPFAGQLSRRIIINDAADSPISVISPMTSLLTDTRSDAEKQLLLTTLGIDELDLDVDYLDTDGNGAVDAQLFNTALKVHKVVTVLADRLEDSYQEIGEQSGTSNDLSASVYRNLAKQLAITPVTFDQAATDSQLLSNTLQQVERDTRATYERWDLELPAGLSSPDAFIDYTRISQTASNLISVVDRVVPAQMVSVHRDDLKGRARVVESVVMKSLKEGTVNDESLDHAAQFILDYDNADLLATLISSLGEESADMSSLARNSFTGEDFKSSEGIKNAVQLPEGTKAFTRIANQSLRISDPDLGSAPSNLKDSELEVYFSGNEDATNGAFSACVKYIDGANSDGTLGDGNTHGELVKGYWSLLGADQNNGASYSLLLTIKFLGAEYQAIVKPAANEVVDGISHQGLRFDYAGDIRTWHSQSGFVAQTDAPESHSDCRTRLPSRVGL